MRLHLRFLLSIPERGSERQKSERQKIRTSTVFVRMIRTSKVFVRMIRTSKDQNVKRSEPQKFEKDQNVESQIRLSTF